MGGSLLDDMIVSFKANLSGLISGATEAKSGIRSVSDTAKEASSVLHSMDNAGDLGKAITNEDRARAKVVLIESQVREARAELKKLERAADAGEAVTGIEEERAKLLLLEGRAQDARDALKKLEEEGKDVGPALSEGTERAGSGMDRLKEKSGSLASSFKEHMSGMVSGILDFANKLNGTIDLVKGFVDGVMQMGSALLQGNISMEQTTVAFTTLLGSGERATAMLKDLQQLAASTPLEFPQIADAARKLLAFGFTADQVKPLLISAGDAVSALGGGAPELDRLIMAMGQMQAKGKASSEELMQMAELGVPALQILADGLHVTTAQAQQMVSDGLVPADKAISILTKGMESKFPNAMAKQSATFQGLMSTLQDNWNMAINTFAKPIFDKAKTGLEGLGKIVSSDAFQQFATLMGERVASALDMISDIAKTMAPSFQALGAAFMSPGFQQAASIINGQLVQGFQQLGGLVLSLVVPIVSQLADILASPSFQTFAASVMTQLVKLLGNVGNLLTAIVVPVFSTLLDVLSSPEFQSFVTSFLSTLNTALGDVVNIVGPLLVPILSIAAQLFRGLSQVLGVLFAQIQSSLLPALMRLWAVIGPIVMAIVQWASESGILQTVFNVLSFAVSFLVNWITFLVTAITGVIQFFIALVQTIGRVASSIVSFFSGIPGFFTRLWRGITDGAKHAWDGIVSGAKAAWAFLGNIVKIGAAFLLSVITAPFRAIGDMFVWLYNHNTYFQMLVDAIRAWVSAGLAWLQGVWQGAINWLGGLWSGAVGIATRVWGMVSGAVSTAASAAWGFLVGIWTMAISWVSDKWNSLVGLARGAWSRVSGVFSSVWGTYIAGPLGDLWNRFSGWFTNLKNQALTWGQNMLQGFIDGIRNKLGELGNALNEAAGTVGNFLGFHSPAKEGPGAELDEWPRNMVQGYAEGILASIPQMESAANKLMQPLTKLGEVQQQGSYPTGTSQTAMIITAIATGQAASSTNEKPQYIYVMIGNKVIGQANADYSQKEIRIQGRAR